MKVLILAGLLSTATALPIPLEQYGGSSSEQRFIFFPPQVPPFFPQVQFPLLPQPPLVLTPNDLIALFIAILNQLGNFLGVRFHFLD
ncbi:secretory calcium-binding phosphoprotein proline-glutamine rich 1 isoform X2 [Aotus nancymaae]|uniref:secretory calcium-binding phosphoprotein proline-glutamine rich 1 isoform X2 n=1 Tax=Aotus nancymaae TaxID=37293 RepID=UPI0030FE9D0B